MTADLLHTWTTARIDEQCREHWVAYDSAKTAWYTEYFHNDSHRHPLKAWSAKNIACALPPRWEELADLVPTGRHSQHLSGKSSQLLALALLGASARLDPTLRWLWEAFSPLQPAKAKRPRGIFEVEVGKDVLNETTGRRTSVDYLVTDPGVVICIECKWCEEGLGKCSCASRPGCDPATGACYAVMRDERPALWATAAERFGLPALSEGQPCPLSPVYQAVRNAAAAMNLRPDGGIGVFGLIYDADNPYFAGCGEWPGWVAVLARALPDVHSDLRFRAVSWQDLMPVLVLDDAARAWAHEKHGLG